MADIGGKAAVFDRFPPALCCEDSLSNIIRTRLSVCLIGSDCIFVIDGRQPACFQKLA